MKRSLLTLLISCFTTALYAQAPAWLWAKAAGGTSLDFTNDIAVDANGNTYVIGSYESATITFGATTLTNAGFDDIFLVKYDPAGNALWAKSIGDFYLDRGHHVAVDASGNVYIAGDFYGGGLVLGTVTLTAASYTSTFVAKYNSAGTLQWAKTPMALASRPSAMASR